jgi:hypothetical protein
MVYGMVKASKYYQLRIVHPDEWGQGRPKAAAVKALASACASL